MFLNLLKYLLDQDLKPRMILFLFSLVPTLLGGLTLIGAMAEKTFLVWTGFLLLAVFLRDMYRIAFKFSGFWIPMIACVIMIIVNVLFLLD